jgi:membrane protein implicated in regulation of membrane protease activity
MTSSAAQQFLAGSSVPAPDAEAIEMILFAGVSAFVTFLAIAAFGFAFLIASSILGDLFEHGDFSHDMDGHDTDGHAAGPSILSSRILSVFVTAFGSFGAIGIHLGYGVGVSTTMGFGGGVLFGGVIYAFASFLYSQQASSHVRTGDLVGNTAQVSVAIPQDGMGQVRCTLGDTVVEKVARAVNHKEIPVNTLVRINAIVGEIVLVERAE